MNSLKFQPKIKIQLLAKEMHKLPNFLAKVGLGVSAEFAFTTLRHIQRYDSITLKKDINENLAKHAF